MCACARTLYFALDRQNHGDFLRLFFSQIFRLGLGLHWGQGFDYLNLKTQDLSFIRHLGLFSVRRNFPRGTKFFVLFFELVLTDRSKMKKNPVPRGKIRLQSCAKIIGK